MAVIEKAIKLRKQIENMAQGLDDEGALEYPELFSSFEAGVPYEAGQRIRYKGKLYKVLQAHTSQADWLPNIASSLFARVLIENPDDIPEWEQPDSTNPYMRGEKVRHNGQIWISLVDNNVWEPSEAMVTLWQLQA